MLSATQFQNVALVAPYVRGVQASATPSNATDPVVLRLSSGRDLTVFDAKTTALQCMEYMRRAGQAAIQPASDVKILSIHGTKLLVCQLTPEIDRFLQRFVPVYVGGQVLAESLRTAAVMTFQAAFAQTGTLLAADPADNAALRAGTPYLPMQLVDWNYQASAAAGQGSLFADPDPITYYYGSLVVPVAGAQTYGLQKQSALLSLCVPPSYDPADGTLWACSSAVSGGFGWQMPASYSWSSGRNWWNKTSSATEGPACQAGSIQAIKSLAIVARVQAASTYTVVTDDAVTYNYLGVYAADSGIGGVISSANDTTYSKLTKARGMIDSVYLASTDVTPSPTLNTLDGSFHIYQFTDLDFADFSRLGLGFYKGDPSRNWTANSRIVAIAAWSASLTQAEMQSNYDGLRALLP